MKNPFQKRTHQPQDPRAMLQEQMSKQAKENAEAARKKAETLLLPLFLKNSENVLDAIVWVNTLSSKLQEMAAERAVSMKVSEFEKEFRLNVTAKHGDRYNGVVDILKEMDVKEAVNLLNEIKLITNEAIEKKYSKTRLEDFLEKKSGIILPS